jgi:chemotaxis methyl-accepting protein methylase
MRALRLEKYEDYLYYLSENPDEMETLLETLTINLSYFFRNPETFEFIRTALFTELEQRKGAISIWSAGCAHGEEPYSLAITAAQSGLLKRLALYGTDIDRKALAMARRGVYDHYAFEYTPDHILNDYFIEDHGKYTIVEDIRRRVTFFNADLFDQPPFGTCDMIMCRNVMIYLDRAAQSAILRNFYNHLKEGGYLIIGKVELLINIPEVKLFNVVHRIEHVYQKKVAEGEESEEKA